MSEELLMAQQQVLKLMQINALLMDKVESHEKLMVLMLEHLGLQSLQAQDTQRQALFQVDNPNRLFCLENVPLIKNTPRQNHQMLIDMQKNQ